MAPTSCRARPHPRKHCRAAFLGDSPRGGEMSAKLTEGTAAVSGVGIALCFKRSETLSHCSLEALRIALCFFLLPMFLYPPQAAEHRQPPRRLASSAAGGASAVRPAGFAAGKCIFSTYGFFHGEADEVFAELLRRFTATPHQSLRDSFPSRGSKKIKPDVNLMALRVSPSTTEKRRSERVL